MQEAALKVSSMGKKLGYEIVNEPALGWVSPNGKQYLFFFSAAALLSKYLNPNPGENIQSVFVFPGSRSALLKFKLLRDPQLRELTANRWHFLKLRTLSALEGRSELTLSTWSMLLDSDPINLDVTTQLRMFG